MIGTKCNEILSYIKSFSAITNNKSLKSRIGLSSGFPGITSDLKQADVILYSKEFVDLFAALKIMTLDNIDDFNRRFSGTCKEFYDFVVHTDLFLPYFAIVTRDGIVLGNHFYFDDENLRSLIVVLDSYSFGLTLDLFDTTADYSAYTSMIQECVNVVVDYLERDKQDYNALLEYISDHYYESSSPAAESIEELVGQDPLRATEGMSNGETSNT